MKIKITLLGICLMLFVTSSIYAQYDLLDFESAAGGTGLTWTVDENGTNPALTFPANPVSGGVNTSATVAQFDAEAAGQTYALTFTDIDAFEFDATNSTIKIKVYKPYISDVGIKFEGGTGTPHEIKIPNTVVNQWEELTFDFSSQIGSNYSKIVIIPDFIAVGPRVDHTLYFDDVQIPTGNYTPPAGPVGGDITFSVDMNDYITGGGSTAGGVFINGTFNGWNGTSNPMSDGDGDNVWDVTLPLNAGAMEYKFTIDGWTTQESLTSGSSCTVTNGGFTNRSLTVNGDQTVATVCWESCAACGVAPPPASVPTTAAPTPIHDEITDNVISVYSDAYTDLAGTNFNPAWGQATVVSTESPGGNDALKYSGLNYQGTQYTTQDVSSLTYLHIDYWADNTVSDLGIYLISPGVENEFVFTLVNEGWETIDIPLSHFTADKTGVFQFKVEGNGNVWLDNIYFHSGTPVPVELTYFNTKVEGNTNVLSWETASELNNSHFEVERSTDGKSFETIGRVEGNGTVYEVMNYNFTDENPAVNTYYRLRQVDFDGDFEYTNIINVKRGQVASTDIKVYPNPVQDRLTVDYVSNTDEDVLITITDITGRILITQSRMIVNGDNQLNINLSDLPRGNYVIRLQSNSNTTVQTIVKQ